MQKSATLCKFGDSRFTIESTFKTGLNTSHGTFIERNVEIVVGDFPLLVGLDVLHKHGLIINFDTDEVKDDTNNLVLPIEYPRGNACVRNDIQTILFTKPELERLHLHFYHPSS